MSTELVIVGAAGQAKETAQLARQIDPLGERWSRISYAAEGRDGLGAALPFGVVRYTDADLMRFSMVADVVIGIGRPSLRQRLAQYLAKNTNLTFPNLVHPSVEIDLSCVSIGRGNIVAKGVVLTCDIVVGDFNLLNWNVTVGHDARLGSFNVVNPGCNVSGSTVVGDGCLLGTGCQILEGLVVGSAVTIGAGAVVTRSIDSPGGTYVGIPAKAIR